MGSLKELAQGIRATNPVIAENRRTLQSQAIAEMSEEDAGFLEASIEVFDLILEDSDAEEMREDILYLTKEMRIGPPKLPGVTRSVVPEEIRVFGRAAKIILFLKRTPDAIHRLDATAGMKFVGWMGTIGGFVGLALTLLA